MKPDQKIDSILLIKNETRELKNHLQRLKNPWQIWTFDVDHTLQDTKPLLENGRLSPSKYIEHGFKADLENLDLVAILAVLRKGVHLCTGKGANFWPVADYLGERFKYWIDGSFPSRLMEETPSLLAVSTGNGGVTLDVLRNRGIVYKPIPLTGWEGMQKWGELLSESTKKSRKEQITGILPSRVSYDPSKDSFLEEDRVTDQRHRDKHSFPDQLNPILNESELTREVEPQLTDKEQAHRLLLAADVRDHVLTIAGEWTKANYVFDFQRIINERQLNYKWLKATGIKIMDLDSFMQAFKILSHDCEVEAFFSEAQGTLFVDILALGINKALSSRLVKNYYQGLIRLDLAKRTGQKPEAVILPKISSLALIDNPQDYSNDAALRTKNAGTVVIGNHRIKQYNIDKDGPVYADNIYTENLRPAEMTNLYLKDAIRIICPEFAEQIIKQAEKEYTGTIL